MNAPVRELQIAGDLDDFRECCAQHRWFCDYGILALPVAVDNLQWLAERWGLVDLCGQDEIQRELAAAFNIGVTETPISTWVDENPKLASAPPRTPRSVLDAFWYVVRAETPNYLANWLADHPRDKAHLHAIWERKCTAAK